MRHRPSAALYRRFSANVRATGAEVQDLCVALGYSRQHVYRVLTGAPGRTGSPIFWERVGPYLTPTRRKAP